MEHNTCQQRDREFSRTVCGYPLPCPYHTVVIDGHKITNAPKGNNHATLVTNRRLSEIADALRSTESG
jgi:hypothetical protein